jgi:hypothetical protein
MTNVPQDMLDSVELKQFLEFVNDHQLKPYRTEWRIFDEDLRLAGSIDTLFHDPDDESKLYVFDWKRSKAIKKQTYFSKKMLQPLEHVVDENFYQYTLHLAADAVQSV